MKIRNLNKASVALGETFRLSLDALRSHKLRSLLTLLGVILAVTTLVAVMSLVDGLNGYVADKIANLGADVFVIDRFGIITSFDAWIKAQKRPPVTVEDYRALSEVMGTAKQIAAIEQALSDVRYGSALFEDVNIVGVTPNYPDIRSINLATGRFLTESDDLHRSPVCFIGADIAKKFFSNVDPVGKTIRAGSASYLVVGTAAAIGTVFGQSRDTFVLIPFGTFRKEWHKPRQSTMLFVQAQHAELLDQSEDEARMLLRTRHHVPYASPDDFGIIGSASITSLWESLTASIFRMALGLTAVFLVVGGIVIMNIMLASVTERTREIGIRRSLGARRNHIIMQFVAESAVLSAVGGIVGIVLALGIEQLVRATISLPLRTPVSAVIVALSLSTGVGLFFGIYPAMRAARLDPIEALRAES
jgi:putative ABC transport system permease protein